MDFHSTRYLLKIDRPCFFTFPHFAFTEHESAAIKITGRFGEIKFFRQKQVVNYKKRIRL